MESQQVSGKSLYSTSVFTLIPSNNGSIAAVIDKVKPEDKKYIAFPHVSKKKFPGGGVENEDPRVAACIEVKEETGLRGINPVEILLECHKKSQTNPYRIHKDIFYLSNSVNEMPLTPGDDIEYAGWEQLQDTAAEVRRNEFVKNHASAFIWWQIRDLFFETKDVSLISNILSNKDLRHWSIAQETLILCFSPHCEECKKTPEMLSPDTREIPETPKEKDFRDSAEETAKEEKTLFVILYGTHFDDYVFLGKGQKEGAFAIPSATFKEKTEKREILQYAAERWGGRYEWVGATNLETEKRHVVVLRLLARPEQYVLTPKCINLAPEVLFSMPYDDWKSFTSAILLIESYSYSVNGGGRLYTPRVNHEWKNWRDRVAREIIV